jgi:hypothetical protein
MNLLYTGLKYDPGHPGERLSYENVNIEAGLKQCAVSGMFNLFTFYPDEPSENLQDVIDANDIDCIIDVPFNDSVCPDLNVLREACKTMPVLSWNCDTSWRFQNFMLGRKDIYTHFITTHPKTVDWFAPNGMKVIMSQWGGSPLYYNIQPKEYEYDVTFIGQKHSTRPQMINAMLQSNIVLHVFGNDGGTFPNDHGSISFDDMVGVFNSTKVNINFSNPSVPNTMPQIKGRHFEIPQCGGFQITTPADGIEDYFVPDKEIIIVDSMDDMINKIKYYTDHDEEREAIAKAGYERMIKDHQWYNRFEQIFKEI